MAENNRNVDIILKGVRLSFLHVWKPQERKNEKGEVTGYNNSVNCLIPKETDLGKAQIAQIQDAMKQVALAQWPPAAGKPGVPSKRIPPERRCLRDGEPKDEDTQLPTPLYEGYEGMMFLSANRGVPTADSPFPGSLCDSRKDASGKFPRLTEKDGKLYAGCYADVAIRIYAYDGKGVNPDRINASLEAIKFVRHGEAFGAKPIDADSAFDEEPDDDMDMGAGTGSSTSTSGAKAAAEADDWV